jgi:hypothetical protein
MSHGRLWTHKTQHSPDSRGSHHLPPYSILCATPRGPHPNGFLSRDSQMGVPKLQQLRLLPLWGRITSCADLWSQWGLKQSCSPCQYIFNGILHVSCMQDNRVDSWLLVVGSQIANLIPDPSFAHNLCCRCPNGSCKAIFDIYASRNFQRYKEHLKARCFDPCNWVLSFQESQRTPKSSFSRVWMSSSHSFKVGLRRFLFQ